MISHRQQLSGAQLLQRAAAQAVLMTGGCYAPLQEQYAPHSTARVRPKGLAQLAGRYLCRVRQPAAYDNVPGQSQP